MELHSRRDLNVVTWIRPSSIVVHGPQDLISMRYASKGLPKEAKIWFGGQHGMDRRVKAGLKRVEG